MFIASLFTITKIWKQLKCQSTDELIKKMNRNYKTLRGKRRQNTPDINHKIPYLLE